MIPKVSRRGVLLFSLLAVLTLAGILWIRSHDNPTFKGKRLSEHLCIAFASNPAFFKNEIAESTEAVVQLGPTCMPLIKHWLQSPTLPWQQAVARWLRTLGISLREFEVDRQLIALEAIRRIPERCGPLLFELRPLFTNSNERIASYAVLTFSGLVQTPKSFTSLYPTPDLVQISHGLTNSSPDTNFFFAVLVRAYLQERTLKPSLGLLKHLLPLRTAVSERSLSEDRYGRSFNARSCLDESIRLIESGPFMTFYALQYGTDLERADAAWCLQYGSDRPQKAVALLRANLSSPNNSVITNCLLALSHYGHHAAPVIPELKKLLFKTVPPVRYSVSSAVEQIKSGAAQDTLHTLHLFRPLRNIGETLTPTN